MTKRDEFLLSCVVVDVETNNQDSKVAEVIEEGVALYQDDQVVHIAELYSVPEPIPPEISAVTNITQKMVDGKPLFDKSISIFQQILDIKGHVCPVAHNAVYDRTVMARYGIDPPGWVCTLRMAKKLFSCDDTVTQFNLSYLRYRFGILDPADHTVNAHRADDDAHVTLLLLTHMVGIMEERGMLDLDKDYAPQIIEILEKPLWINRMPFGKHRGELLTDIPFDYWKWAIKNMDSLNKNNDAYDADLSASVEIVLNKHLS